MKYFVNGYLKNPNHAITVHVVGCGGTGSIRDDVNGGQHIFEKPANPNATGELDGLPYAQLQLQDGQTYPAGTLITGNFNGLVYGIPNAFIIEFIEEV